MGNPGMGGPGMGGPGMGGPMSGGGMMQVRLAAGRELRRFLVSN
jgi:hypothetical protein